MDGQLKFDEKELKIKLIDYLLRTFPDCVLIGVEVPFKSMKRRVDVLMITSEKELIAFEIKSDMDSLRRLDPQIDDYRKTFDMLYVATSSKFQGIRLPNKPSIGYIYINGQTEIRRKAKKMARLDKEHLSLFVFKDELTKMGYDKKEPVGVLRSRLIKDCSNIQSIRKLAIDSLIGRYKKRFDLFKKHKETKGTILADLDYLTKDFDLSL